MTTKSKHKHTSNTTTTPTTPTVALAFHRRCRFLELIGFLFLSIDGSFCTVD